MITKIGDQLPPESVISFDRNPRSRSTGTRNQVAVTPRLDAENTKAVLGIVVGDALDETRQHFLCR